ncbi:Branched-chain amino acid transport protein (AzlD) [Pseudovibrio axinellae]|uniref:Branched-chain amino acid transport protein (AzlD) n=1 Tax=Pseudovibrio axinellae TaxID=989403 RepID=A0A166AB40_9HYPH|nr:AzlD domain-containing protein [Pseudovibrio axinellae]KZL20813.1 Branched-chain amino acid transport protein (AzlD) [Pseudovibrio axinellae]SER21748.1 Branched-chain amino acid transport protein (AzlD) [Pseudovibrio axinellae]
MSESHFILILTLSVAAFSIRLLGLLIGDQIRASKQVWILDDLPGLIVVSLVASSLADQSLQAWLTSAIALAVAVRTNHVIMTMGMSMTAYAIIGLIYPF